MTDRQSDDGQTHRQIRQAGPADQIINGETDGQKDETDRQNALRDLGLAAGHQGDKSSVVIG